MVQGRERPEHVGDRSRVQLRRMLIDRVKQAREAGVAEKGLGAGRLGEN